MLANPPHIITLPNLAPQGVDLQPTVSNPEQVVTQWLSSFEDALKKEDFNSWAALFRPDSWWRDHLGLSWDLRTLNGLENISNYIKQQVREEKHQLFNLNARTTGRYKPTLANPRDDIRWVESMFDFETNAGRGSGVVRLVHDGPQGVWKCYLLSTTLLEIKGAEELIGGRRPHGGDNSLISLPGKDYMGNWQDHRERQKEFVDSEPVILVVGAGQSGLCVAARLEQMGMPTLIIDRNERVGDNWRQRYRNWPMFTPKDKLGDWFEIYASTMELNIWTSTTIQSSSFDDTTKTWTVDLKRSNGTIRTVHPHHVVFCTGQSGEPKMPTFKGQSSFKGLIYHASRHRDASDIFPSSPSNPNPLSTKKVLVIGTGNSGHDISQNYHEAGAQSVTLLQRSPTLVISSKLGFADMHRGSYDASLPPLPELIEETDVYEQSKPLPIQFAENVFKTAKYRSWEQESLLDPLQARGFQLTFAPADSGIFRKYITDGGGYYIDVGCSRLIIDGRVHFLNCSGGISHLTPTGAVLADGRPLDADVIVCATGYSSMRETVRKVMGDAVADRTTEVWDLDAEGEVRSIWRPSGHPRFWYMGGNLALCRHYSKLLALQIVGVEKGLNTQE